MRRDGNRVLQRMGARELKQEEINKVVGQGLFVPTLLSVIVTNTSSGGFDQHLDS